MGNIRGWAGPLTPDNRKAQFELQLQSLARMRELGMTPVLSGFSGHVPAALERIFPGIKLTESHTWNYFNSSYTNVRLLDPRDKHFIPLAKGYYEVKLKFTLLSLFDKGAKAFSLTSKEDTVLGSLSVNNFYVIDYVYTFKASFGTLLAE